MNTTRTHAVGGGIEKGEIERRDQKETRELIRCDQGKVKNLIEFFKLEKGRLG